MSQPTYSYRYRPAYGNSGNWMIEFMRGDEREELMKDLMNAINSLQPVVGGASDMLFVVGIDINTTEGTFGFSKDEWGGVFLDAAIPLLDKIDELLIINPNFEKVEINPDDFR